MAVPDARREFLAHLQRYCVEGRYPEAAPVAPSRDDVVLDLGRARETLEWLTRQSS